MLDLIPSIISFFDLKNIIDIFLIAVGVYSILFFVKKMYSYVIAYAIMVFVLVLALARLFRLDLTSQQLHFLLVFFVMVFALMFQRELRKFFDWIIISTRRLIEGKHSKLSHGVSFSIMKAVQEMASKKIGALIVLPGELPLDNVVEGGFALDGFVSVPLLLSIFDTSSPGHDGAVIIDNNRIKKFGVHLPLAENYQSFHKTGTRHRAAVGATEKTDAMVIVVSEERGEISIAKEGKLEKNVQPHVLEEKIGQFISVAQEPEFDHFWRVFLVKNRELKLLALFIAFCLKLIL